MYEVMLSAAEMRIMLIQTQYALMEASTELFNEREKKRPFVLFGKNIREDNKQQEDWFRESHTP